MFANHLVRVGVLGQIGRFRSVDGQVYVRGTDVVCRTNRGLEVGEVLSQDESQDAGEGDGNLLRQVTNEDRYMIRRLQKNRRSAIEQCNQLLATHQLSAVLLDVEHLFDGQSLYFYFLGDVDEQVAALTNQLADVYETKVRFKKFADTLKNGCGPDCGTKDCSSGSCSNCAVSGGCMAKAV